jgi:lipopolysaccharide transport system ATP-binding protein
MSSEVVIRARDLSKAYALFRRPEHRLMQMLSFGRRKLYEDFWALKNVDLDVYRGETVGIIGCNGSGRSTLLQLICGILTPTYGQLSVDGKVAALLERSASSRCSHRPRRHRTRRWPGHDLTPMMQKTSI